MKTSAAAQDNVFVFVFVWHLYQTAPYQCISLSVSVPRKTFGRAGTPGIGKTRCHPLTFKMPPITNQKIKICCCYFIHNIWHCLLFLGRFQKASVYRNVNHLIPEGIMTQSLMLCFYDDFSSFFKDKKKFYISVVLIFPPFALSSVAFPHLSFFIAVIFSSFSKDYTAIKSKALPTTPVFRLYLSFSSTMVESPPL